MADSDDESARTQMVIETSEPAGWRLGGVAVAGGLMVSLLVHMGLIGTVVFVSPRLVYPAPVDSVAVDLVTPDELAATQPKPDDVAQPMQPPPQPGAQPQPQPGAQPPEPARSAPPEAFASPLAPALSPPPLAAPRPAPPSGQAAELARLLGLPAPSAARSGGGVSEYQAGLTADEIAAFAAHVQTCWSAPAALAAATKLSVVIRVNLGRDGGLTTEPVLIAAPASAQGPALVQSAMRALQKCLPYGELPAAKYDEWHLLDLKFSPSGLSTAVPVPGAQRTQRPG